MKRNCHRTNGTFGFARHTSQPFTKPKEPFFCQRSSKNDVSYQIYQVYPDNYTIKDNFLSLKDKYKTYPALTK